MVFGVDVFDLDFGVQISSIEQPIKSNSLEGLFFLGRGGGRGGFLGWEALGEGGEEGEGLGGDGEGGGEGGFSLGGEEGRAGAFRGRGGGFRGGL